MIEIIQGDCLEELPKLKDESFDAVVTDPPFGVGFQYIQKENTDNAEDYWNWFSPIYNEINRVVKKGGFIAIWQAQRYMRYFWDWYGEDIHVYAGCKNFVTQLYRKNISFRVAYEPIVIRYNGKPELKPSDVKRNLDFFVSNTALYVTQNRSIEHQHPSPKPLDQVIEIIDNFVIEKGLVLDPFGGSGTTAVACKEVGRSCILIEKEPTYCEIARKRVQPWIEQTRLAV